MREEEAALFRSVIVKCGGVGKTNDMKTGVHQSQTSVTNLDPREEPYEPEQAEEAEELVHTGYAQRLEEAECVPTI